MSSGKIHSAATIGVAVGLGVGYTTAYVLYPYHVPALVAGALYGVLSNPDLDLDVKDSSSRRIGQVFFLLRWWWDVLWKPYRVGVKHRSWISHWPIVSTAIRLLYCISPLVISTAFSDQDETLRDSSRLVALSIPSQVAAFPFYVIIGLSVLLPDPILWWVAFFIGLALADTLHWIFDTF